MASREAYQRQYQAQLRDWDANVKQLKAKTSQAKANLRLVYEGELKVLAAQRALAQRRLDNLVQHEEEAWDDLRQFAEEAWRELGRATDKARVVFGLPSRLPDS